MSTGGLGHVPQTVVKTHRGSWVSARICQPRAKCPPFSILCRANGSPWGSGMRPCSQSKRNLLSVRGSKQATIRRKRSAPLGPERERDLGRRAATSGCEDLLCANTSALLFTACFLPPPRGGLSDTPEWKLGHRLAGRAHKSHTLRVVAVSLPPAALCGLSRSRTRQAAPTSACRTGRTLSLSVVASLEPTRKECWSALQGRRPGFRCLSKQIGGFLFSWSGTELFPPVGTRCLFGL